MSWYLAVLKKYADFSGRARRTEYWYFALFNLLIFVVLGIIAGVMGSFSNANNGVAATPAVIIFSLYYLAVLVPSLAVSVRRLHDTGRSARWLLISLVPFIGGIWFLILLLLDSVPGANQWGPNPKEVPVAATSS